MEELLSFLRKFFFTGIPVIIIVFFSLKLLLFFFEEKLIFFPYQSVDSPPPGSGFKEVFIDTEDGLRLNGWFYRSPSPGIFVLFFHGNAGDLEHRGDFLLTLKDYDLSFLAIDYRGYGKSEGSPTESGIVLDAKAAYRCLVEAEGVEPGCIVPFGRSIGSYPAAAIAADSEVAGLILEGTFTSIVDVASRIYFFLPVRYLMRTKFDNTVAIKNITVPKLFIHAGDDEIIAKDIGLKLYAQAPEPKELYIVAGAGHNDTPYIGGKEYYDRISAFLKGLSGKAGGPSIRNVPPGS